MLMGRFSSLVTAKLVPLCVMVAMRASFLPLTYSWLPEAWCHWHQSLVLGVMHHCSSVLGLVFDVHTQQMVWKLGVPSLKVMCSQVRGLRACGLPPDCLIWRHQLSMG
jgi:hypothetical protein